jgi:two-component system, response regulator PdtaR
VQDGGAPSEHAQSEDIRRRALRVLIVEDEFYISLHTTGLLQALGHSVVAVAVSADQAVSIAARERPDVVLMDIRLIGSRDGTAAADEINGRFGIGSIFVTANTDVETCRRAEAVQPLGFLEKPLTEYRLRQGLSNLAA